MKTSTSLKERLPRQQNGDPFPFVMLHGSVAGNVTTGAESITELVGELIGGYDDIPQSPEGHDQALGARYDQAVGVATTLQGSLAAQAAEAGVFDPSAETEEALTALFTERTNAFEGIHDGNGEITLDWQ
ncbi:MAG: hypothetical protein M3Y35_17040, partial [Actinomycetota bacterium]|nr:hypothetical protein [Actinomycetota bacterium]